MLHFERWPLGEAPEMEAPGEELRRAFETPRYEDSS